ncbi:MAG: PH domain-containing protein [Thermoguttaceae bacterium]
MTTREYTIDRASVAQYFTLCGIGFCLLFTFFFGIGIVVAIIYATLISPWLSPKQSEALQYSVDGKVLRVNKGVYFLSRKAIPLDRITDLALVQGPVMRFCGIWALQVQTAGAGGPNGQAEAVLYGVENAEQVREEILALRDEYLATSSKR